ncbi:MAG: hypothetical protein ACFFG0_01225 [Candidatus Thorarchaeota archaeon]
MFKLITLSDSGYLPAGKMFFRTRDIINADVVLYGPSLTKKQLAILRRNKITYESVDQYDWDTKMQYLKFDMCLEQIELDQNKKYSGFTLSDLDVFFVNDWEHVYKYDFDFAIITRPDYIKRRILRSYGCGGGFFFKHSAKPLFEFGKKVMLNGGDKSLPEYDRIWKTLETGRPAHKTHYRTSLRWWVDQIFISSIVLRFFEQNGYRKIGLEPIFTNFRGLKIAFFSTKYYNVLDSKPVIKKEKNIYIRHLKHIGRDRMLGKNKIVVKEKL